MEEEQIKHAMSFLSLKADLSTIPLTYQLTMCGNLSFSFCKVFAYNLLRAYIKNYINDHNKIYVCIPMIDFDKTMSWCTLGPSADFGCACSPPIFQTFSKKEKKHVFCDDLSRTVYIP